jgi:hypothetical protein
VPKTRVLAGGTDEEMSFEDVQAEIGTQ